MFLYWIKLCETAEVDESFVFLLSLLSSSECLKREEILSDLFIVVLVLLTVELTLNVLGTTVLAICNPV